MGSYWNYRECYDAETVSGGTPDDLDPLVITPGEGPEMKYSLKKQEHSCLCEALRRFECFAIRSSIRVGQLEWNLTDLQKAWTGLGYPSEYQQAVRNNYMIPAHCPEQSRVMNWYRLTMEGAKIVLFWHIQGYSCGPGWELQSRPPRKYEGKYLP